MKGLHVVLFSIEELHALVEGGGDHSQPVVGAILGAIFLGDKITPLFIFGGLLIGIGLIIASTENG